MTRRSTIALLTAWLVAAVALRAAEIKVTPLVDNGRVYASFSAADALTPEGEEVLRSGLLFTLTYDVEVRRPTAIWFDPTLARVTVSASAKYDPLTGKYQVDRARDGKIVTAKSSEQLAEIRGLLTEFEKVPLELTAPLEPNGDYYVRVRLHASPRTSFSLWWLWPWGQDDGAGRATFTYIQ
ncbi:MAG: DUF4390 domain-containing protein [Vicinamibacterales bacterium]